jgi:hypothetical protein
VIPKIIWQTYEVEYDALRNDYKMASLTWKNLNPQWEYRYCSSQTRDTHIKKYSHELYHYYKDLTPLNKSDVWRLCVLHRYGGFYTDMDSVCQAPIDYVLKNYTKSYNFMLSPKSPSGWSMNGTMASLKQSDVSKKIIDGLLVEIKDQLKVSRKVNISFERFSEIREKCDQDIDFNLFSALHTDHLKDEYKYTSDFDVNWYGTNIKYFDLAKLNSWNF